MSLNQDNQFKVKPNELKVKKPIPEWAKVILLTENHFLTKMMKELEQINKEEYLTQVK